MLMGGKMLRKYFDCAGSSFHFYRPDGETGENGNSDGTQTANGVRWKL